MEMLPALKCSAIGIAMDTSSIAHVAVEQTVLVAQSVGRESTVGQFYGSVAYKDLSSSGSRFKTYVESIMSVSMETFLKWANSHPETAKGRETVQYSVWIGPAPFCAMCYVENERNFPLDGKQFDEKLRKERKPSIEFYQTDFPSVAASFRSYRLLAARTWRKLKYGEEIFVDYDNSYESI